MQGRVTNQLRSQLPRIGPGTTSRTRLGKSTSISIKPEESDGAHAVGPTKCGVYAGGVEMPFTSKLNIMDPANIPVSDYNCVKC